MGLAAGVAKHDLLHPQLPDASLEQILQPNLHAALQSSDPVALRSLVQHEFEDVYSLAFLKPCVCTQIREEAEAMRAWAKANGVASPGLLLSSRWYLKQIDRRYDALFDRVLREVLRPLDAALYGQQAPLAYHHDYCICYEEGADRSLKPHTDDSDITLNVFLGSGDAPHEGAELLLLAPTEEDTRCGTPRLDSFAGTSRSYVHTEVGRAVLHPGDRWHAVQPLRSGCRWNLLTWAMRFDCAWKGTFYQEMEEHLRQKALL